MNAGASRREPAPELLRGRYEQIRERALAHTASGIGNEMAMRQGMRSWMEAGWQKEVAPVVSAPGEGRLPRDPDYRQIVALWASMLVGLAERSYGGQQREA